jgi:hypothetical protein
MQKEALVELVQGGGVGRVDHESPQFRPGHIGGIEAEGMPDDVGIDPVGEAAVPRVGRAT